MVSNNERVTYWEKSECVCCVRIRRKHSHPNTLTALSPLSPLLHFLSFYPHHSRHVLWFLLPFFFFPFLLFSILWWFISVWHSPANHLLGIPLNHELLSYLKCPTKRWLKSLPSISCPCRMRKFSIKTFIFKGQSSMLENPWLTWNVLHPLW